MADKIIITNLRAYGIIGIYPHERETPQTILINATVFADTRPAAQSDDITLCVNYADLAQKLKHHAESARRFTVEALANDLAEICLHEKGVEKAVVRVEKPEALAEAESVGVEVERRKQA
ncbi:MAG: dihydroneopterin aldolase [Anaerolineales bacterium]